ncbi:MAG: tripartite tricarboxylate transporter TctB family protein [Sphaerochaetaceae bacterium]|nr:tripartite tricarboxylate transporter TctB family protein [Sphaerochaetaceae bacterium]
MAKNKILNADSIFGMIMLIIAITFIAIAQTSYPGMTKDGVPGSKTFPIVTGICVAFFSVLLIIDGIKKQNSYFELKEGQKKNLIQMLEVYGAIALFMILWNFVPFIVAAIALEVALCKILKLSWKFTIIYSVIVVVVLYVIFAIAFKVRLNIY